jgi:hypothetical protein
MTEEDEKAIKNFIKNMVKNRLTKEVKTFKQFFCERNGMKNYQPGIAGEALDNTVQRLAETTADYQDYLREFYYG